MPSLIIVAVVALLSSLLAAGLACFFAHRMRRQDSVEWQEAINRLSGELALERFRMRQIQAGAVAGEGSGTEASFELVSRDRPQRPTRLAGTEAPASDSSPSRA